MKYLPLKTNDEEMDLDVSMFYKRNTGGESKGNVSPSTGRETEEFTDDSDFAPDPPVVPDHIRVLKESIESDRGKNEKFKHQNATRGRGGVAAMKGFSRNFVSIDSPPELNDVLELDDGQKSRLINNLEDHLMIQKDIYGGAPHQKIFIERTLNAVNTIRE